MTTAIQPAAPAHLPAQQRQSAPAVRAGFFDIESFELLQRVAKGFASSDLVPQAYRGNLANCLIALDMAQRVGAAPLQVMQNLYVVHGTPGWSSKFLVASINSCGRFSALRYEWRGEPGKPEYGCRAWALEKATGERLDGIWVDWKMVKAEGWDSKNGSKWKTMPDQMFLYRAAAFWVRAYAPEVSMGLQTAEELGDIVDVEAREVPQRPAVVHVPTPGGEIPAPPPVEQIDPATGEVIPTPAPAPARGKAAKAAPAPAPTQPPAFDVDAAIARVASCTDRDVLSLMADEWRELPESPDLGRLMAAYRTRDAELSANA